MRHSEILTPIEFRRLFSPVVRVDVDWTLLAAADATLTLTVVDSLRQAKGWYFPWYLDAHGSACGWDEPTAKPVLVIDWRKASSGMSLHRRSSISELATALRRSHSPAALLIPTYDLGADRRLVLDGSHRLAAIIEARPRLRGEGGMHARPH